MKRTEQHRIESDSKLIFESIVPRDWSVAEITSDYGKDLVIEIFENDNSTGRLFFVQLKGSMQEIVDNTFKIQLKLDYLEYFKTLSVPVLLVCVSTTTRTVWATWGNTILDNLNFRTDQKTITLKFDSKKIINEEILKEMVLLSPTDSRFNVRFECDSELSSRLCRKHEELLDHFFGDYINISSLSPFITFQYENSGEQVILNVKTEHLTSSHMIENVRLDLPYLNRPVFSGDDVNEYNIDFLLTISFGFQSFDACATLKILELAVVDFDEKMIQFFFKEKLIMLLINVIKQKSEDAFFELLVIFVDLGRLEILELFVKSFILLNTSKGKLLKFQKRLFSFALENLNNPIHRSQFAWNLARVFEKEGRLEESARNYFHARKLNHRITQYKDWCLELGGILFRLDHFYWAQCFYEKSVELDVNSNENEEENWLLSAKIADCLFHQGKFTEASKKFSDISGKVTNTIIAFKLKGALCLYFVDNYFERDSLMVNDSMSVLESREKVAEIETKIEITRRAIELNPLNYHGWYYLGLYNGIQGDHASSAFAFITCSLIEPKDIESICFAVTESLSSQNEGLISNSIDLAFEMYDENFLNLFSDFVFEKLQGHLDEKRKLVSVVNELYLEFYQKK